jgi:hypothetical protein
MQTAVKDARKTAVCIQTANGSDWERQHQAGWAVAAKRRCPCAGAAGTKCAVPKSARSVRALARDVATLRADIERYRAELRAALELVMLAPNDPAGRRGAQPSG